MASFRWKSRLSSAANNGWRGRRMTIRFYCSMRRLVGLRCAQEKLHGEFDLIEVPDGTNKQLVRAHAPYINNSNHQARNTLPIDGEKALPTVFA